MDRKKIRWCLVAIASTVSVFSAPAAAQVAAPSVQRAALVRVGLGTTLGGGRTPYGMVAQASVGLGQLRNVSIDALASVRWQLFDAWHANFFTDSDTSRLQVLSSVAARMRVTVSRHIAIAAFGGLAAGSWKDLPSSEADRKPIRVPYVGAGGVFSVAHDVSIES